MHLHLLQTFPLKNLQEKCLRQEASERQISGGNLLSGLQEVYAEGDICFGVGQISSMDADELREIKERLIPFMVSECGRHGVSRVYFMLTDIMEQSTELLFYGEGSEEMAVNAFKIEPKDGTIYLKGVVSRKKQLIPPLMEAAQMIGSDYV